MQRRTLVLGLVVVAINFACCAGQSTAVADAVKPFDDVSNIMGEAVVSVDLTLHHHNASASAGVSASPPPVEVKPRKPAKGGETQQKFSRETGKSEHHQQSMEELENDYSFLSDKIPDLPDDEYLETGEDNTPFSYLKYQETIKDKKRDAPNAPMPIRRAAAFGGGSPIYITVPIYINTAGVLPLKLTVGGQEVPLETPSQAENKNDTPKALPPTSQYNRLLDTDGTARKQTIGQRQTNRHRSNIRAKKHARKRNHNTHEYRPLGTYRLRV